jgi:hypothetical protein
MKRYIRATTISEDIIETAISYASSGDKGTIIDRANHKINFVCGKGVSESLLISNDYYLVN